MTTIDLTSPDLTRPGTVNHPILEAIVEAMRVEGRHELVHYAGACYRDDVAWHLCLAWLADRKATEAVLRSKALKAAWGWDVDASHLARR